MVLSIAFSNRVNRWAFRSRSISQSMGFDFAMTSAFADRAV
jgi:hypothetical protein